MDATEELIRLIAIQVRSAAPSQTAAIIDMNRAGFGPARIADLLGTTPNTVNQALIAAKKQSAKK